MLTKENLKNRFLTNDKACNEIIKTLELFSSKTRFRILCILLDQDFCVSDIAEIVEDGKISNISQQLKILTLANILSRYRVGKMVFYKLEDERIRTIVNFLHQQFMHTNN